MPAGKGELENTIDNLTKTVYSLEHEKYVVRFEVGVVEGDRLQQVIDATYNKIRECSDTIHRIDMGMDW